MGISEARDSLSIIKRQQRCNTLAVKDGEESIVEHMVRERGRERGRQIIWYRASRCANERADGAD